LRCAFFGAVLASVACSGPAPTASIARLAITGGEATPAGAWPTVAWLDNGCSGVLVAPDVVLYAGHCGVDASTAWFGDALDIIVAEEKGLVAESSATKQVAIDECRAHPESGLGLGTDVAFCLLSEPVLAASYIPPIALGCAREQVQQGAQLTLVGFGIDGNGVEMLGTKRSTAAETSSVGRELVVGDEQRGPCAGDSGGPALVAVVAHDQRAEWALAGILSSGVDGTTCSAGYYTDLSQLTGWLEKAAARDVTPCFEGSAWQPTERCLRAALDDDGLPVHDMQEPSQLCGKPYQANVDVGCSFTPQAPESNWTVAAALAGLTLLLTRSRHRAAARRARKAPWWAALGASGGDFETNPKPCPLRVGETNGCGRCWPASEPRLRAQPPLR